MVLGVGAKPNTDLFKSAGFELEEDGSIRVDEYMRVKDPKAKNVIFAIGDIAKYPDLLTNGDFTRIGKRSYPRLNSRYLPSTRVHRDFIM